MYILSVEYFASLLDIRSLYLHLFPNYYTSGVTDHQQGIGVDASDLALTIQLTFQDLLYSA